MTKSELIKKIHDSSNYSYNDIECIVDLLFDKMVEGLSIDKKVVISGFGTFEKYYQEGYVGVNPSTGQPLNVPGNNKVRFSISKKLKDKI